MPNSTPVGNTGVTILNGGVDPSAVLTVKIDQTTPGTTNNVSVSTATGAGATQATAAKQDTQITAEQAIQALLGTTGIKILKSQGAANVSVSQVTASTSAATLAIARATRRGLLIRNTDAAITVYIGPATVTSGNGFPILAGESLPVTWVGLWQVIAASGSPVVAIADEYD